MPLFRLHRGSLEESLATTIIVRNLNDVIKAFLFSLDEKTIQHAQWGATFRVTPYPEKNNNFDPRIGWYTHLVSSNLYEENVMTPIGFLSENITGLDK